MAYLCKDEVTRKRIKEYINRYVRENTISPSIRDIAAGTGISRAMVQRYMAAMRADGEISYARRNVSTEQTRQIQGDSVAVARGGTVTDGIEDEGITAYFTFPRAYTGEGAFCILEADDDSMSGADIRQGDLLLVCRTSDFTDGDIVIIETNEETILLRAVYSRAGGLLLRAANPKYGDTILREGRVAGVVTKVMRDLPHGKRDADDRGGRSSLQVFLL